MALRFCDFRVGAVYGAECKSVRSTVASGSERECRKREREKARLSEYKQEKKDKK